MIAWTTPTTIVSIHLLSALSFPVVHHWPRFEKCCCATYALHTSDSSGS